MDELHRQAYLDAMGVDVYFPRLLLPAAPPPTLCEVIAPVLEGKATDTPSAGSDNPLNNVAPSAAVSQGRAAAMQALLGEVPAAVSKASVEVVREAASKIEAQSRSTTPRFMLSITCVADVLIIDDAPVEGGLELQRLQKNFFAALGLVTDPVTSHFKWPIVESSHLDQSDSAAKQTLAVFVQSQLKTTPAKAMLLMGETAANYLLDDKPVMGEWFADFIENVPVLCAPSLLGALGTSDSKQHIWQALKPLRKKLAK